MKRFISLGEGSTAEREARGTLHTVAEILQQPDALLKVPALLSGVDRGALRGRPLVYLGAGSSSYIGEMLVPSANLLGFEACSIPTTDAVSHPRGLGKGPCLYVSFARSGNSPESLAAIDLAAKLNPQGTHAGVTCNAEGAMALRLASLPGSIVLTMPEETNDKSLAMTSSVSAMYAAGLGLLYTDVSAYTALMTAAAEVLRSVLDRFGARVFDIASAGPRRVQYLGSGAHFGVARETRLKMQEMTEGRVVTQAESYLGLRHGPQVFVTADCLVVAYVSAEPRARAYELELLKELKTKRQGLYTLAVCDRDDGTLAALVDEVFETDPEGLLSAETRDAFLVPSYLAVGQMLATVASLNESLKPDSPSESGIINRVVQGVTIVPWEGERS